MKTLSEFIKLFDITLFEASKEQIQQAQSQPGVHMIGGKCGWWATAVDFNKWLFDENNDKAKRTLLNMFGNDANHSAIQAAIIKAYDECSKTFNTSKLLYNQVPFVIYTDKTNKFAIRDNVQMLVDIKSIMMPLGNPAAKTNPFSETHTGFGTSATKGLKFETVLRDALIEFIKMARQNPQIINDTNNDQTYADAIGSTINTFKCCQKINELVDIITRYGAVKDDDLQNYIIKTGQQATNRQTKDLPIINPDNFSIIDDANLETILKNSGNIIADLTLKSFPKNSSNDSGSNDDIYISCKIGEAQLSGIANNKVFYINGSRKEESEIFAKKDLQENDSLLNPLKGLCELLGLNFQKVFDFYKNLDVNKYHSRSQINYSYELVDDSKSANVEELKKLILCIIGSNYIYVNGEHPDKITKIDFSAATLNNIELTLDEAGISDSGRTIKRKFTVSGKNGKNKQNCFFAFRQSLKLHRYPYRMFVGDLDVQKFIEGLV